MKSRFSGGLVDMLALMRFKSCWEAVQASFLRNPPNGGVPVVGTMNGGGGFEKSIPGAIEAT